MWQIAASGGLDLNSGYKYLLFCRDFSDTSAIARVDGEAAAFVTGYMRPGTDTLFVWQIAVRERFRQRGLAMMMLDDLVGRRIGSNGRPSYLEATVTPGNSASLRLFRSFAHRHGAASSESELFPSEVFAEQHEPEILIRSGPLGPPQQSRPTNERTDKGDAQTRGHIR